MEQRVQFVRVFKLSRLLETFFIASVTSILVIRTSTPNNWRHWVNLR